MTPRGAEGAVMPAEWAPHDACWMGWPCREEIWGDRLDRARLQFAHVAHAIAAFEPVIMVAPPEHVAEARRLCRNVEVREAAMDDSWLRDTGPCFTLAADGSLAGTAFTFNAWGGKYAPFDSDAKLAARLLDWTSAAGLRTGLIAEGGALAVDGEGTLITTETCLLNPNRNAGWSRGEIEAELRRCLGVRTIIWLPGDPEDTDTDGHVDNLAAFVAPGRVLVGTPTGRDDPRYPILEQNRRALSLARDAGGRTLELLPIPEAYEKAPERTRYCRSYVNFYVANGGVVVPQYGVPGDVSALEVVGRAFPGRRVVGVDVTAIAYGGGAVHCITQQQPRPRAAG